MKILLAYGKDGLEVDFPETPGFRGVLRNKETPILQSPASDLRRALQQPIASASFSDIIRAKTSNSRPNTKATVVISDITRPVPNSLLLPPILKTLEENGVLRANITILIGTGTHRPNEGEELYNLVGRDIAETYNISNHRATNRYEMTDCGRTSQGVPVLINRTYTEADIRILTGFIEPHLWAGYSGGRKALLPGVSSMETMRYMHGYTMVANPGTQYGKLDGNPFNEAGLEVLRMVGADFIVNVTLNKDKQITGFWCGAPVEAHLAGCQFLEQLCQVNLEERLDFAVTTNGGAPIDCNLYQTVKGVAGADLVVRKGGSILIASACTEGPGSCEYTQLVESIKSPESFLVRLQDPDFFVPDQWCAQEMWQVLLSKKVLLKCESLEASWLRARGIVPVEDITVTVHQLLEHYGTEASWAVIPDGPYTITRLGSQFFR